MAGDSARVLFLCTHNAARSQMAEGILRHLGRGSVDVSSAGTEPSRVHPLAIRVLQEMGIDVGGLSSKRLDEFRGQKFDFVVTLCDSAREVCPVFPGAALQLHWSFHDPGAVEGTEEVRHKAFQQTARDLTTRIRDLLSRIERGGARSPE